MMVYLLGLPKSHYNQTKIPDTLAPVPLCPCAPCPVSGSSLTI